MKKKGISIGAALMLVFLGVVTTFNITFFMSSAYYKHTLDNIQTIGQEYSKLTEVRDIINKYFVGEYETNKLMDGAVDGYVESLGDTWSSYFTAEEYKMVMEASNNKYVGVGITIAYDDGLKMYTITSVTDGGPAFEAGIRMGDKIKAVNSTDVSDVAQNELVSMVRGPENTQISLTIVTSGGDEVVHSLTRREIYTPDVTSTMYGDIGFIRIDAFDSGAEKEFEQHLKSLVDKGAKGLIFDVRMNGGGGVDVMASMLDKVLPEGTIISLTDKEGRTDEYRSDANCLKMPMAVLANAYSISAAEFFAAAMQEYGVGTVIGEHTGGKGFAQTTIPLTDGSAVNISAYKYYTPKGKSLANTGIVPDIEVKMAEEQLKNFYTLKPEEDNQLQEALKVVQGKIK